MTIRNIPLASLTPALLKAAIATRTDGANITLYEAGDTIPQLVVTPDPDAEVKRQFRLKQSAELQAQLETFKTRAGSPEYKAGAVRIEAKELGILEAIDAAAGAAKPTAIYWETAETISRADAEWLAIEAILGAKQADSLFSALME